MMIMVNVDVDEKYAAFGRGRYGRNGRKEVPSCSVAVGRGVFVLLGDELMGAEETLTFFLFGTVTAFGTEAIVGAAMDVFCIFFIGTGFFFIGDFGFVGASSSCDSVVWATQ
jgi:hypothetical protein